MATKKSNQIKGRLPPVLKRFEGNPILRPGPSMGGNRKPSSTQQQSIKVVSGDTDTWVIGYASSRDGVHIDEPCVIIAFSIGRYGNSEELFKHTSILA
jgi:hypothetical protein